MEFPSDILHLSPRETSDLSKKRVCLAYREYILTVNTVSSLRIDPRF